ncbi:MAG: hypothetical protein Q9170_007941, partial [Blastenia crenularia]
PLTPDMDSDQISLATRQNGNLPWLMVSGSSKQQQNDPMVLANIPLPSPKPLVEFSIWNEDIIKDLVQMMEGSFPWKDFAGRHELSEDFLRQAIRDLVITPLCLQSDGKLQEFFDRIQQYDLARKEYRKFTNKQERQEARDLRDHEKLRSKELWKGRKAQLKQDLAALKTAWEEKPCTQAAIERKKAVIQKAKCERNAQKAAEKRAWKVKISQIPHVHSEESDEDDD